MLHLDWKTCLRAAVTVVAVWLLVHYWTTLAGGALLALNAAAPLLLGCVIAYVVNIPMSLLERLWPRRAPRGLRRPVCLVLAFALVVLILTALTSMLLPELGRCIQVLVDKLPDALNSATLQLRQMLENSSLPADASSSLQKALPDWNGMIGQGINLVLSGVGGAVGKLAQAIGSLFSAAVMVLVGLIFASYLLLGKERLAAQCKRLMTTYLPRGVTTRALYVLDTVNDCFHSFIVGQCIEAVILGALCTVAMLLFRLPYASMIGVLIGFTALIPIAGAYIGAAVGAFMIFTVSPVQALVFIIVLVVVQQLEGNLIYPRVVGASIGLPGIWVLAAVTIGGGVLGVGGMLLGVPLAASLYRLLRHDMNKRADPRPDPLPQPQ